MAKKKTTPAQEPEQTLEPELTHPAQEAPEEALTTPEAGADGASEGTPQPFDAAQTDPETLGGSGETTSEGSAPVQSAENADETPFPEQDLMEPNCLPADSPSDENSVPDTPAAQDTAQEWPPESDPIWPEAANESGHPVCDIASEEDMAREVFSVDLSAPASPPNQLEPSEDVDPLEDEPLGDSGAASTMPVSEENEEPIVLPEELARQEEQAPQLSDRQKFFALKFNRLDRNLTPEERQEWNSIYASYRGRSALCGTIIGIDPYHVDVWNRERGLMERQTMYCAIVIPYRVRIVIPATEMWERGWERPDFVLQNMVGATIDFIITKVDRESGFAIASRRLALRARRYYFAHRPQLNAVGTRVKCRVMAVGPRRCLVECFGHDINLTQREMRYTAIPDLRNEYHPGMELECVVKLYVPEEGRLEVSVKETESNPYEGAEQRHPVGSRRQGMVAGKYGGGVFCNLPDGTVCMCNYSYQHDDSDFLVGDTVILVIQRFDEEKKQMYGKILSKW